MTITTHTYPVAELSLSDIVPDIQILLDNSHADVDGITVTAELNPAWDPAGGDPGEGALLVRFTDAQGRSRVASLEIKASWREDGCWHPAITEGQAGPECSDCGTPCPRCPGCGAAVYDLADLVGVHAASCTVAYATAD